MWKKQLGILLAIIAVCLILPITHASAASELNVKVTAGFDGKAKYGKGAPITVVIENKGTSAFSGDMVIDTQQSYDSGVGEVFPMDIEAGETKTVTFIVPKMFDYNMYGMNAKSIYFYEGGWKNGKEINHKGSQQMTVAMYHDDTKIITVFTDNIDRVALLKSARLSNYGSLQLIDASKITSVKIPDEAAGWGPTDMIVIDEYPIADLSSEEQDALLNWVRAGGMLIVGGSDHVTAEAGVFAESLPMVLGERTTLSADVFNQWIGGETFDKEVAVAKSELNNDSHIIYASGTEILAASKQLGKGLVIQTSFSLGDEPFSKMAGASKVWSKIIDAGDQQMITSGMTPYYDEPMEALSWTVGSSNELFPSFKVSAPFIFGIIIIYIILIIPVLYFLLKRKDKREHAWWIIPAIAVTVSIFIFAYGAKDRIGKAQLQQTSVFDVDQDGTLSGYFVESVLTNKAGDFVFNAPKGVTLTTQTPYSSGLFGPSQMGTNAHKKAIIEKDATGSNLYLRDIGYWNVATVYGQATVDNVGTYTVDLTVKDKKLTGEITNNFPFQLKDVSIWSGTKQIVLGDLGPGETIKVDETLKTSTLLRKQPNNSMNMGQSPSTTDDLMKMRKEGLINFSGNNMNSHMKPAIIGYTDSQVAPIDMKGTKASIDSLTMVSQAFSPTVEFTGDITIDPEMMTMNLISEKNNLQAHPSGYQANLYYFDEDVYIQTWTVPDDLLQQVSKWKSIDISKIQKTMYDLSILNQTTGEFEPLESERKLSIDPIGPYMTDVGTLSLRLEFSNNQYGNEAQPPEVRIHGEVKK